MGDVKPALENSGFAVGLTSYGRFGILRFLAPFRWLRNKAIRRVANDIRTARRSYKIEKGSDPKRMSVISHSFGTYVVGRLLTDYPEFEWYRVIFCGSVVREDYPLDKVLRQFTGPLLNEIGTKDFLPALAESAGWGYGSVGSTGFNRSPVETRWHHGYRHSDFLTEDFCKKSWIPFLEGNKPEPGDKPVQLPLSVRLGVMLPLRWIFLAIAALCLLALGYFLQVAARDIWASHTGGTDNPPATSVACNLPSPMTSFSVPEASAKEILNLLGVFETWRRDEKFKELYLGRFIGPQGWTGAVEGPPDAKDGLCKFMVSEDGTSAHILVNTCEKTCNFRKGDRVQLSGWLMHRGDDYIEIGAARHSIIAGVPPHPPKTVAPSKVAVVCHGEQESLCKAHQYDVFEHCGDDNGVGGADPHLSGHNICGTDNFEVHPAEGGSIPGNHCGYSWYRIACK